MRITLLQVYEQLFVDATPERMEEVFNQLDTNHNGHVDYIGQSSLFSFLTTSLPDRKIKNE